MLEIVLTVIGLVGFGAAAWLDLKTTEFPDWLPYSIIGATLTARLIFGSGFFESILLGSAFLGFGLLLYFFKQWGDGDAWLFGALGFLLPTNAINVLLIFFIISFIYLVAYSLAIGLAHPDIFSTFRAQLRTDIKAIISVIAGFTFTVIGLMIWLMYSGIAITALLPLLSFPALFTTLLLFSRYGRLVEQKFFRKQISVTKLKPSDVLLDSRWRSLTKKEIEKIRAKGGKVWIKEGVRFAPVFFLSFIVCILIG